MDKSLYFQHLHSRLAKRYKLEPRNIYFVRRMMLGENHSKHEVIMLIEVVVKRKIASLERTSKEKLIENKNLRDDYAATIRNVKSMKKLHKFLSSAEDSEIDDILQRTEYDQQRSA